MSCQTELPVAFIAVCFVTSSNLKLYIPSSVRTVWNCWQVMVAGVMDVSYCLSLTATVWSDCAVNISASPLGLSCDFVSVFSCASLHLCVCEREWAAGCSLAQPAMLCWLSAHRAPWAVNNAVPQPRAPDRARRGGQDANKKEKMSASGHGETKSIAGRGEKQVDVTDSYLTLRGLTWKLSWDVDVFD